MKPLLSSAFCALKSALSLASLAIAVALVVGAFAFYGCDHGGDVPYAVPFCEGDVSPCPGYPTRNTLDGLHIVQAECADINASSLACQIDTGRTYAYAACSACSASWHEPSVRTADALEKFGVRLCSPLAYRTGAWCAVCSDPALSMQFAYMAPQQEDGGFASDVLCVTACGACQIAP
jgi:hypothetical protein